MFVQNSKTNGVFYKVAYSRVFEEFGLQTIERGETLKMRGGFNLFVTVNDSERTYFGYGDKFEVSLSEAPVVEVVLDDGAIQMF